MKHMKIIRWLSIGAICWLFVISLVSASAAAEGLSNGTPYDNMVAAHIQPLIENGGYVGIVVGVVDAHGRHVFGFGKTKRDGNQKPSGDTVFPVASLTKVFTGVLLADCVWRGIARLDDPITKYLPPKVINPNNPLSHATLLDLATHTSGLPKNPDNKSIFQRDWGKTPYSASQLYEYLGRYFTARPPGSKYEYSNTGIALLGHLLERASGIPYERLVHERICEPLGLQSTAITPTAQMRQRFPDLYGDEPVLHGKPVQYGAFDVDKGAAGLYTTINDMMTFISASMGLSDAEIAPSLLEAQLPLRPASSDGNAFMGLAWHVKKLKNNEIIFKNGYLPGYDCFMAFSRTARIGIIALANTSPKVRTLEKTVANTLLQILPDSQH